MNRPLQFEWDEDKDQTNFNKHRIRFAEAAQIFRSPTLTTIDARHEYGERREISIGRLGNEVYLVVVHTDRLGIIRLISARRAKRTERHRYDEHIQKNA